MASRIVALLALSCLMPGVAAADGLGLPGLGLPGLGPRSDGPRPSYRESYDAYPPPQHNALGMAVPPPAPADRPSYRETYDDFPPAGGRYGGGFVEYLITGGRMAAPETAAPAYAPPAAPDYVAIAPNPAAAALPRSGLPDTLPDEPPASYGGAPVGPQSMLEPMVEPTANPMYRRQTVAYAGRERPGTIVIDTPNKFLYLVEGRGQALRYGIGVGRPGFSWAGIKTITRKAEWPDWTPPREMLARRPDLPRHMAGGEANPLGARALYLGSSMYRIHGTNQPTTIGTNVSSGCIRMMNADVIDLYGRVGVGTRVVVL